MAVWRGQWKRHFIVAIVKCIGDSDLGKHKPVDRRTGKSP